MNTKKITSLLAAVCLSISCFTGVIPASAEDASPEAISAETVYAAILNEEAQSEISVDATQQEGFIEVSVTSEALKAHKNANDEEGYWAGFAVVAPEGATHYKYAFGTSEEITLGETIALTDEDIVTAQGDKGIAFYADAGDREAKTYAKLQWLSDETTALTAETSFVIKLDDIKLDGFEKREIAVDYLDKKTESVDFYDVAYGDEVSVDFSKIKMEYYMGKDAAVEPEFSIANVCDSNENEEERLESVYKEGSYKVECVDNYEGYTVGGGKAICITMEELVMHKNANQKDGYWTGFTVKAPEGAKYLDYNKNFGESRRDTIEFTDDKREESFYINVTEWTEEAWIYLLWLDENRKPLSRNEHYWIDVSDVDLDTEIVITEANVCDSFPGENAPAKVYDSYTVEQVDGVKGYERINISMTGLALHRNGNKEPGYWTGFTVKAPVGAKYFVYDKTFGDNRHSDGLTELAEDDTEISFYIDAYINDNYENFYIQFFDKNQNPITRYTKYIVNLRDIEIKYPEDYTVTTAAVADYDGDIEAVYDEYDVECEGDIIRLSAENLKAHTNGNGEEGHWIGFAVNAPEGATHYTYCFKYDRKDDNREDDNVSESNEPVALEEGETSVSFYVDASDPCAKDYLEIRWYSDAEDPESYPYVHAYDYFSYYIYLGDVDLADNKEVEVTSAMIVDQNNPEVAPYTGTPSLTVEDEVIKLEVEELKTHMNAEGKLGAWAGVSISRPEGAKYVKYAFGSIEDGWAQTYYSPADEVADEASISFYTDVFDETPKNAVMVQWFDESEVAITNIIEYMIDFSGVDCKVDEEKELTVEKANIVDQSNPEIKPYEGEYGAVLEDDTIKLSADLLKVHENGEGNDGTWIGFNAYVEGAKYLKYVFYNEEYDYYDWYNAEQIEVSEAVPFYVDVKEYDWMKDRVALQWFDENGNALTNVNTYKINVENVTLEEEFDIIYSNIELTGEDARFYNLISADIFTDGLNNDEFVNRVSTADYVYVLTFAENGNVEMTVNGEDESNGGNVFYRNADKTVTLTATADSGYAFTGWYDIMDDEKVSTNAELELPLNACYVLEARFNEAKKINRGGSSGGGNSSNVARPKASVAAGEVEAGTKVELTTVTEDADIYYTLDGTEPTNESTLYTEAVEINEDVTLKAIAYRGKTKSSVLTVKYTVKKSEENVSTPKFVDIANYEWAKEAIETLAELGIIKGVSETEYAPAKDIKRADFMLLLVRMLNLSAEVTDNFADVTPDKYYYEGIGIAKALGLTNGVGDNNFNPEASITRQDMFTLAYRILKQQGVELTESDESAINTFNDFAQIADYAKEGLASLVKNELVKGSDNMINPVGNATRAETAVFIYRLYNLLKK